MSDLYIKGLKSLIQMVARAPHGTPRVIPETSQATRPKEKAVVSDAQILDYQRQEIGKELLLLERHLSQQCKIAGLPCPCCTRHPLTLEALATETTGMTNDPIYGKLIKWTKEISPITTKEASASGKYEEQYPKLAIQAREFRKQILKEREMGDG